MNSDQVLLFVKAFLTEAGVSGNIIASLTIKDSTFVFMIAQPDLLRTAEAL